MDAHNVYLSLAGEMGIPTLAVVLGLLGTIGYYAHWLYRRTQDRTMQAMALGFLAGLVGLVVVNCFNPAMDSQEVTGYFWILCALIMRAVGFERAPAALAMPTTGERPT